jgi:hypothetical protein
MQTHRQGRPCSANWRIRRGKKATGRIVVSTLGFGLAYYFDTENGELRRKQLRCTVRQALRGLNEALAPDVTEPAPTFHSVLRTDHGQGFSRRPERGAVAAH